MVSYYSLVPKYTLSLYAQAHMLSHTLFSTTDSTPNYPLSCPVCKFFRMWGRASGGEADGVFLLCVVFSELGLNRK